MMASMIDDLSGKMRKLQTSMVEIHPTISDNYFQQRDKNLEISKINTKAFDNFDSTIQTAEQRMRVIRINRINCWTSAEEDIENELLVELRHSMNNVHKNIIESTETVYAMELNALTMVHEERKQILLNANNATINQLNIRQKEDTDEMKRTQEKELEKTSCRSKQTKASLKLFHEQELEQLRSRHADEVIYFIAMLDAKNKAECGSMNLEKTALVERRDKARTQIKERIYEQQRKVVALEEVTTYSRLHRKRSLPIDTESNMGFSEAIL